jgi:hypothetical protein
VIQAITTKNKFGRATRIQLHKIVHQLPFKQAGYNMPIRTVPLEMES